VDTICYLQCFRCILHASVVVRLQLIYHVVKELHNALLYS
jgi:hypothetical protein